jgi:hypothetical protein
MPSRSAERHFGPLLPDDDRVTKDGLAPRNKAFRSFLQEKGMAVKVPINLPTAWPLPGSLGTSARTPWF